MSRSMMITGVIVFVLAAIAWVALVANAFSMNDSDAAGNGLSQSFAIITVIVLWILLAVLLVVAGGGGRMPGSAKVAALILIPASAAAAFMAIALLTGASRRGFHWPMLILVLAPAVIMAYAAWTAIPALHNALSTQTANVTAGLVLLVLCILPLPQTFATTKNARQSRARIEADYEVARAKELEDKRQAKQDRFDKLTQSSRLWLWMDFLDGDSTMRAATIAGISTLPSRQSDAESMFAQSMYVPMYHLPVLSLAATPALCDGAKKFLLDRAQQFESIKPGEVGRTLEYHRVDLYLPSMRWLADHGCDVSAEAARIETGVAAYAPSAQRDEHVAALKALRGGK